MSNCNNQGLDVCPPSVLGYSGCSNVVSSVNGQSAACPAPLFPLALTTSGSSGPASLVGNVLNIPIYTGGGASISLTTTGTSGAATLIAGVLNIPIYTAGSTYTFSTGLTNTSGTITVNASQSISTLSNLTGNGFVKTSGGTGALSIDTSTYLTANQTITLTGDTTGSGATSIATTTAKINGTSLAGLASGVLYNTTTTGVPSIATANQIAAGLTGTTGTLNLSSATVTLPAAFVTLTGIQTLTNKTLTSPVLTTPALGTPSSGTLTSCTGLPIAGITGLGTGVATALADAVNQTGGFTTVGLTTYTPSGTTQTIDFSLGQTFRLVLSSATGTVVLTFSNAVAGSVATIIVSQGGTPRALTFPANTLQNTSTGGTSYVAGAASSTDVLAVAFIDSTHALVSPSATTTNGYH